MGVLAGTLIVVTAPLIAAHRMDPRPDPAPWLVLLPGVGIVLTGWRPWRSAFTEVGAALVFAGLALRYGSSAKLILAMSFATLLGTIAYIDLDYRLVLNRLSMPGIVLALALSFWWPGIGIGSAALGAGIGLLLFGVLQIVGRGALGTGDTKLAVLIGAMRGCPGVINALVLGIVLGGLAAAFFLFVLRRGRRESMAYAPYLSAGAVLSLFLAVP